MLIFLSIVILVAGVAFAFTGAQLAKAFAPGSPGRWGAWAWAAALWLLPLLRMMLFRRSGLESLQAPVFFFMGMGATHLILLLLLKLSGLGLGFFDRAWSPWAPWILLGLAALLCLAGFKEALQPPQVKTIKVPVQGLHPDLEGLRIVQISDLHVSESRDGESVARLEAQVQALQPDLIAVTGDLVDGEASKLGHALDAFAQLKPPLGTHFVTGNHEYFWNAPAWEAVCRRLGWEVLGNGHRLVKKGSARLRVLGVNDPTGARMGGGQGPDLARALSGTAEEGPADFTLFLAHQPQYYAMADKAGADLFLAGHTHGGQFYPFPPIVSLFHKYFRGLYRHNDKLWVYVHTGSGYWGPPNRLGVPPELALLVLEAAKP